MKPYFRTKIKLSGKPLKEGFLTYEEAKVYGIRGFGFGWMDHVELIPVSREDAIREMNRRKGSKTSPRKAKASAMNLSNTPTHKKSRIDL